MGKLGHPGQLEQSKGCSEPAQVELLGPEDKVALQRAQTS